MTAGSMKPRERIVIPALPSQPTVREVAYQSLRQLILNGTLAPNQRLFENELAEQMGISRTPVREALRQLETEGLVRLNARRGAVVAGLSAAEMREEFQIRAALEALAIRLAAAHLTATHVQALAQMLRRMEEALARGDGASFLKHHRAFHMTLFTAAQAPRLCRMLENLLDGGERYRQLELMHRALDADELAHHARLLERLKQGDGERAAAEYVADFLAHGERVIQQLLGSASEAEAGNGCPRRSSPSPRRLRRG